MGCGLQIMGSWGGWVCWWIVGCVGGGGGCDDGDLDG